MSATFKAVAKALNDNPELAGKVMAVDTPAERAEILKAAGIAAPTHADVNSFHASLSDVSGAGTGVNAVGTASMNGGGASVPAAASAFAAS